MNIRIHGRREVFPIVNGTDISNLIGTRPELELDGSGWAPSWMLAALGQPHPRVTWGATITGRVDATLEGPVKITYSDDSPTPGDTLIGTQRTKQFLPWAFMAGGNVDVSPHVEIGAELRYWLYRQYKKQHIDVTGIFLVRELETTKNYNDAWQVSGGVRVHDLAAVPRLELMAGSPPRRESVDRIVPARVRAPARAPPVPARTKRPRHWERHREFRETRRPDSRGASQGAGSSIVHPASELLRGTRHGRAVPRTSRSPEPSTTTPRRVSTCPTPCTPTALPEVEAI